MFWVDPPPCNGLQGLMRIILGCYYIRIIPLLQGGGPPRHVPELRISFGLSEELRIRGASASKNSISTPNPKLQHRNQSCDAGRVWKTITPGNMCDRKVALVVRFGLPAAQKHVGQLPPSWQLSRVWGHHFAYF